MTASAVVFDLFGTLVSIDDTPEPAAAVTALFLPSLPARVVVVIVWLAVTSHLLTGGVAGV